MIKPKRIFLAPGAINLKSGVDALKAQAQNNLEQGFQNGDMVVFCNKKGDALKILHFDGDYDLFYYKLENRQLPWPKEGDYRKITKAELQRFLKTGAILTSC